MRQSKSIFQHPLVLTASALLCCALWGSAFPGVKVGYALFHIDDPGSQILFAGYRFFLAGVFTLLLGSLLERRFLTLRPSSLPLVFGQGLLQTTAQYTCFYLGLAHTTGAKGSILNASSTFFSILAAHVLLRNEPLTRRKVLGCLVGFLGVLLMNLAPGGWESRFAWNGEGLVLLCSIAYGVSSVTLKQLSSREHPTTITAYQFLFGGGVLVLIGLAAGGTVSGFTPQSAALLLYLALLSTVAFTLWAVLLHHNPVGRVAIFGFSIPVFGTFFSVLVLREQAVTPQTLAALGLVCLGIWLVNRTPSAPDPQPAACARRKD